MDLENKAAKVHESAVLKMKKSMFEQMTQLDHQLHQIEFYAEQKPPISLLTPPYMQTRVRVSNKPHEAKTHVSIKAKVLCEDEQVIQKQVKNDFVTVQSIIANSIDFKRLKFSNEKDMNTIWKYRQAKSYLRNGACFKLRKFYN